MRALLSTALDAGPVGEFCGAALIARGADLQLSTARGFADRDRAIPNTLGTRFAIGSLTKQFTAAAILCLEAEGRLSVDDPIDLHLGDFPEPKNTANIQDLLTHTGGLVREGTTWVTTSRDTFVQAMKETPMESVPGARCRYSNAGFGLLGAIIETATGTSYEEVLASRFFRPLGMTSSGCFERDRVVARSRERSGLSLSSASRWHVEPRASPCFPVRATGPTTGAFAPLPA